MKTTKNKRSCHTDTKKKLRRVLVARSSTLEEPQLLPPSPNSFPSDMFVEPRFSKTFKKNVCTPTEIGRVSTNKNQAADSGSDYTVKAAAKTSESKELEGTYQERKKSLIHLTEVKSRFYCLIKLAETYAKLPYVDILVTLRKIRLHDVYSRIGDDFDLSTTGIQKIFARTVSWLAMFLLVLIFWPIKLQILKQLLIRLTARYRSVQSCYILLSNKNRKVIKCLFTSINMVGVQEM